MTLMIMILAAVTATIIWYLSSTARKLKVGSLCFMYCGASLMWLVDAFFEYAEIGAEYFAPAAEDMLNDFFLGLSAAVLGAVIWVIIILVKDPVGTVKAVLTKK